MTRPALRSRVRLSSPTQPAFFHITEIATLDPNHIPQDVGVLTKKSKFYTNLEGKINEAYEYFDERGNLVYSGVSTNVPVFILERERCAKIVDSELGEGNWIARRIRSGE